MPFKMEIYNKILSLARSSTGGSHQSTNISVTHIFFDHT